MSEGFFELVGGKAGIPDPVWLADDYIPDVAISPWPQMCDDALISKAGSPLIFDIEVYENYWLVAFMCPDSGQIIEFAQGCDLNKLRWVTQNFLLIGFNSRAYDLHILTMILHGCSVGTLRNATASIIEDKRPGWKVLQSHHIANSIKCDHIDIINIAPLSHSLKLYGGRMHTENLQRLPFAPDKILNERQQEIVRWYCGVDLQVTAELYNKLRPQIDIRVTMSHAHKIDLRSKSDAQIAETVLAAELAKSGVEARRPPRNLSSALRYAPPAYLQFQSGRMQDALRQICEAEFPINEKGYVQLPEVLKTDPVDINGRQYRIGIGGLHSCEKSTTFYQDGAAIYDIDVVSYYPNIILNLGLYPEHLTSRFLDIFRSLTDQRIAAKRRGDKTVADTLKIVINGTFGKLSNSHSQLYAPDLFLRITLTGQLALLLLIERLEAARLPVASANTDGVMVYTERANEPRIVEVVEQWERDTGFETEANKYRSLHVRDVNNYIAIAKDRTMKRKGVFAPPTLSKNPENEVCVDAVCAYLKLEINSMLDYITVCDNIEKFCTLRTVRGGAVQMPNGQYLGDVVRWYHSTQQGAIVYAKNGNQVPRAQGARALMTLPDKRPSDVDVDWYGGEAESILRGLGVGHNCLAVSDMAR